MKTIKKNWSLGVYLLVMWSSMSYGFLGTNPEDYEKAEAYLDEEIVNEQKRLAELQQLEAERKERLSAPVSKAEEKFRDTVQNSLEGLAASVSMNKAGQIKNAVEAMVSYAEAKDAEFQHLNDMTKTYRKEIRAVGKKIQMLKEIKTVVTTTKDGLIQPETVPAINPEPV